MSRFRILFALAVPLLATVLALASPPRANAGNGTLHALVGIEPVRYLVERVGGAAVSVETLVKPGHRPETYEPTPRQMAALARAHVFFGVGMPLEAAWHTQVRQAGSRGAAWVSLAPEADAAREGSGDDRGHDHDAGVDPHHWLNPLHAQRMVADIAGALGRLAPGRADTFDNNAARLRGELGSLHRGISALLKDAGVDAFLVFHPAWGHFARAYGLEQIAIESGGKEPGPRSLAEVIEQAKRRGIRTVFIEPRQSRRLAETVAEAIGGQVRILDPLAYDYIDNLRSAAAAIGASGS